eukprot:6488676-Amphidinium_carterae.1
MNGRTNHTLISSENNTKSLISNKTFLDVPLLAGHVAPRIGAGAKRACKHSCSGKGCRALSIPIGGEYTLKRTNMTHHEQSNVNSRNTCSQLSCISTTNRLAGSHSVSSHSYRAWLLVHVWLAGTHCHTHRAYPGGKPPKNNKYTHPPNT